jgi:hypothetical protein
VGGARAALLTLADVPSFSVADLAAEIVEHKGCGVKAGVSADSWAHQSVLCARDVQHRDACIAPVAGLLVDADFLELVQPTVASGPAATAPRWRIAAAHRPAAVASLPARECGPLPPPRTAASLRAVSAKAARAASIRAMIVQVAVAEAAKSSAEFATTAASAERYDVVCGQRRVRDEHLAHTSQGEHTRTRLQDAQRRPSTHLRGG